MLIPSILLLLGVLIAGKSIKSPLAIYCIVWIACMIPSEIGLINYNFLPKENYFVSFILFSYNILFVFGYKLAENYALINLSGSETGSARCFKNIENRIADFVALVSIIGVTISIIDFKYFQGIVLDNFSQVRDSFEARQVNLLTQVGSLLTWGALYTLPYLIINSSSIKFFKKIYYFAPVIGLFYFGILSAGRQVAFQILIISTLSMIYKRTITKEVGKLSVAFKLILISLPIIMVLYMGFIAHQRNDGIISDSKAVVLEKLFDFELDPLANELAEEVGPAFKDGIVEGVVYFNSPVNLFAVFISLETPPPYLGMMTFPLIGRRLEWLTGTTVLDAMQATSKMMADAGVIDVGWSTSYGSFILDFGLFGCGFLLLAVGFLSCCAWRIFLKEKSFSSFMLVLCAFIHIIYIPLLPAISDTNIFFLTIFSISIWQYLKKSN